MRFKPCSIAIPAAVRSSGADTAAAAATILAARCSSRPSQLRSALPPSETPTATSGASGTIPRSLSSIQATIRARRSCRWAFSSIECLLDAIGDRVQYLDARVVLVLGLDQRPRCDFGAGAIDHVAHRLFVRVPFLAVAPVVGGDLELLERRAFARLETPQLLGLADLQPELDDDRVAPSKLLLELIDLVVGTHPVVDAAITLDALDEHAAVPRTVEDRDAAIPRHVSPETPQIGKRAFFLGRGRNRYRHILPRVERPGDSPDRAALARGVDPLEDQDQRALGEAFVPRKRGKLALMLFERAVVVFDRQLLRQVEIADELDIVDDRRRRRRDRVLRRCRSGRERRSQRVEHDLADREVAIASVRAFD